MPTENDFDFQGISENSLSDRSELNWLESFIQRHAEILRKLRGNISITDRKGRVFFASDNMLKAMGTWRDQFPKARVEDIFLPEFRTQFPGILELVLKGKAWQGEISARRPDRRIIPEWVCVCPMLDDKKQIVGSIIVIAGIKERRQLEQILQPQVKVLDAIEDAITVTHRNGTIVFVNKSMIKSSGLPKEAFIGYNNLVSMIQSFGTNSLDILRLVTKGETWEGDLTASNSMHGRVRISPLFDRSNKVIGMVSVTLNSLGQNRLEELLKAQKEILETLGDALVTTDLNGTFIDVSEVTLEIGGWQREGVIGRNIRDFIIPEYHDRIPEMMKTIKEGKTWLGDLPATHGDGRVYHGLAHASPLRDHRGEIIGVKAIVVDVRPREEPEIKQGRSKVDGSDIVETAVSPPDIISADVNGQVTEIKGHLEAMRVRLDRIGETLAQTGSRNGSHQERSFRLSSELLAGVPSIQTHLNKKRLEVQCLGPLKVRRGDLELQHWPGKRAKAVFEYLIARPKMAISREVLEESLWPNQNPHSAAQNLRAAIHDLRQLLDSLFDDESLNSVIFTQGTYFLNPELELVIDAVEFEEYCSEGRRLERNGQKDAVLKVYEQAETIYRGDYLEEELYEEWAINRREVLKDEYLLVLNKLADYAMNRKDYESCISYCQKTLAKDVCREDVYRRLMCCYSRMGQKNRAIQWYRNCRQTVKTELHIALDPKTVDLYQQITRGEVI